MARSPKKEDSVYDFLYIDTKRIGLLLSQFGSDGIITELVRATDATSETGGKLDLKIVGINQKEGKKTGLVRKFDPQWLIPLLFLKEAQKIIARDIEAARIGQLVLMSGSLTISDLSILRLLWDVQFVQQSMVQGAEIDPSAAEFLMQLPQLSQSPKLPRPRQKRDRDTRTPDRPPANPILEQVRGLLEIIKVMPHGIMATLERKPDQKLWCSLRDEWMIVSSSDLMLNHGSTISGEWNVVGVLDARPEGAGNSSDDVQPEINPITPLLGILQAFGPLARQLLGRPSGSFGVTPLLIFREITD